VARAYLDQLERSGSLPASTAAELSETLDRAAARLGDGARDERLAARLESLAPGIDPGDGDGVTAKRRAGLTGTLSGIAAKLR
jgi:hypothetical protein